MNMAASTQKPISPEPRKAIFFAGLAILMWSTVATAFKLALRYQTPYQLLFYSALISTVVLFVLLATQKQMYLIWQTTRSALLSSLGLGFLNPFCYYLVLFQAYNRLPAQEAQPLNYTWPIFLSLLAVPILKQPLRWRSLIAFCISPIGVLIIATRGDLFSLRFSEPIGVSLALCSGLIWGLFWTLNVRDQRPPLIKLFLNFFCGLLFIAAAGFFTHGMGSPRTANQIFPGWLGLAAAAYVAIFEMSCTFFFWLKALTLARSATMISNLAYLIPFISFILIQLITNETIRLFSIIGLLFILSGILVENYSNITKWYQRSTKSNITVQSSGNHELI